MLQDAITQYHRRVPTRDVNRVIADAQQRQPAGGGAKVMYAVQGATDPPTFTLFVNRELPQTYLRYLERSIREAFEFGSTPLKLRVRKRNELTTTAMPWCEDCAKYWAPSAMNDDGTCPRCGADLDEPAIAAAHGSGTEQVEDAKTPWHFKLLIVMIGRLPRLALHQIGST